GIVAGIYCPEDFDNGELPPAEPPTNGRKKTTFTTTTVATSAAATAADPNVIDAEVEPVAAAEATDTGDSANDVTTVLMEIELTLGQIGMTKADLEAGMKKKNPAFTTIDSLSIDQAKAILEKLRAKKQASQAA